MNSGAMLFFLAFLSRMSKRTCDVGSLLKKERENLCLLFSLSGCVELGMSYPDVWHYHSVDIKLIYFYNLLAIKYIESLLRAIGK